MDKDKLILMLIAIVLGSGGGTIGSKYFDNDKSVIKSIEREETAQWQAIKSKTDQRDVELLILKAFAECP
jgi:hypothetical protein